MYHLDKLKKELEDLAPLLVRYGVNELSVSHLLHMANYYVDAMQPDVQIGERCNTVLDKLLSRRDWEPDLTLLEKLINDPAYSHELKEVSDKLREAVETVRETEWETEQDNAKAMLTEAGFEFVERDDFEGLERTTPGTGASQGRSGKVEQVSIEMSFDRYHHQTGYEFTLTENGVGILNGKSGEFSKLLAAVGISQEAGAKS